MLCYFDKVGFMKLRREQTVSHTGMDDNMAQVTKRDDYFLTFYSYSIYVGIYSFVEYSLDFCTLPRIK